MTKTKHLPLALIFLGLFFIALIPDKGLAQDVMTNQSVVDLVKSGVSEKDIVAKIRSSKGSKFDLSPAARAALEKAGVTKTVILAIDQNNNGGGSTPVVIGSPIDINNSGGTRVCDGCVRYRVIITQFVVNNATSDSPVSRDGFGDEVFVAANFAEVSSHDAIIGVSGSKKSVIYGDMDGRPVGVGLIPQLEHYPRYWTMQAGSGHPTGGLVNGDEYPRRGVTLHDPSDASAAIRGRFIPMTLWEGDLRAGANPNGVIILPTIWESDNVDDVWNSWNRDASTFLLNFARHSSRYVSGAMARPIIEQVDNVLTVIPQRRDYDRPVGMDGQPFDPIAASPDSATFVPAAMFLTADKAEEAVAYCVSHGDYKIDYRDGRLFGPGNYTLFIRVERVR
ncbi:MAG: hypothetical protein ABI999_09540 [Acidobacteriota bacterium]